MIDYDKHPGIATRYRGVEYRSLLECRWSIVFELLGLHHEYEGIELQGYLPDFLVDVDLYAGPGKKPARPTLFEVRPHWTPQDYRESIDKIARSGWTGPAVVVGATVRSQRLFAEPEYWCGYGHPEVSPAHADPTSSAWFKVGYNAEGPAAGQFSIGGSFDLTEIWKRAGNLSRWSPHR